MKKKRQIKLGTKQLITVACLCASLCTIRSADAFRYPRTIAGITILKSTGKSVTDILGEGRFKSDIDMGGAHYYRDRSSTVELSIAIETDDIIGEVSVDLLRKNSEVPHVVTIGDWFHSHKVRIFLGDDKNGVGLGSTVEQVVRRYGKPTGDFTSHGTRTIEYRANYKTDPKIAPYVCAFRIENNRVIGFAIDSGGP